MYDHGEGAPQNSDVEIKMGTSQEDVCYVVASNIHPSRYPGQRFPMT